MNFSVDVSTIILSYLHLDQLIPYFERVQPHKFKYNGYYDEDGKIISNNKIYNFIQYMIPGMTLVGACLNNLDELGSTFFGIVRLKVKVMYDIDVKKCVDLWPNLRRLNLSHCWNINNLSCLAGLNNLIELDMTHCWRVTDISVCSNFINLRRLNCYYTDISDVTCLANCGKLRVLNLEQTRVYSIDGLKLCGLRAKISKCLYSKWVNSDLHTVGLSRNLIRIMSGMGGLTFSN